MQNDILTSARDLAILNGWEHHYCLGDIWGLLEEAGWPAAEVVIGGFPCQDFSHAGKRQGLQAPRGNLYQAFVAVVEKVKPLIFVAENVHGLLTMPENPLQTIKNDFTARGYVVRHQLLKCEELGIPQTRWRVIIMGLRQDYLPMVLARGASQGLRADNWNELQVPTRTCVVSSYLRHLPEPAISSDPAHKAYSRAQRLARGQGQKAIDYQGFAPTMRAEHHGNIEFRRLVPAAGEDPGLAPRRLSVREVALIQTFPPDCLLTKGDKVVMSAYKPLGNAVPPLLGYLLACHVEKLLGIPG